jgi:alpha-1,6-mannosyltransferase
VKLCDLTQFYSPFSGGVKRYLQEKAAFVARSGIGEHLLVVPGETDAVERDGPTATYTIRSPLVSRTSRYRALLRLERVEEILERERPDLIEVGDPYQMAWKAIASGRALGIPVVGFYHSHFSEAYLRSVMRYFGTTATEFAMEIAKHYTRALYGRFAATLVPSPALADLLRGWGIDNVAETDLGVDTDAFYPDPADKRAMRAELGVGDGEVLLLYVGRLAADKNVRTLFAAFETLCSAPPEPAGAGRRPYRLAVIGDGPQRKLLDEVERSTGRVIRERYCSDPKQLARHYRAADLFVHPGVQETFGLAALESQASGTPVVGIRGSYMDRIILTDQDHWATENSPEALAEAIGRAGSTDFIKLGGQASLAARTTYAWDEVFTRLFAVYRRVIGR